MGWKKSSKIVLSPTIIIDAKLATRIFIPATKRCLSVTVDVSNKSLLLSDVIITNDLFVIAKGYCSLSIVGGAIIREMSRRSTSPEHSGSDKRLRPFFRFEPSEYALLQINFG